MTTYIDFFSFSILKALVIPFHEKRQKPDMSVWKSLPLHQSRVWSFRQANRA